MITIKTTVAFGLTNENLSKYTAFADDYEKKLKDEGIFWGRKDSTTAIAITSQRYLDIKKREEQNEVQTVSVPASGDK